jgi:hypothetical protein
MSDRAVSVAEARHPGPGVGYHPPFADRAENRFFRSTIEIGLISAVFLAVAGFGGTQPVAWAISQDLIFLLSVALVVHHGETKVRQSAPALLMLVALVAWVFTQWLCSRYGKIGFDTHAIETRGLAFASGVSGFFVALEVSRDRVTRRRLALSLIGLALFESLWGLAQYPGAWQYIWAYHRVYYTGSATGTYINHNHFAGLLEMILPLCLGLAFYYWNKAPRRSGRRSVRDCVERLGSPEILKSLVLLLVAIILFVAVVFSFSRMGLVSVVFSLAMLAALAWAGCGLSRVNWKLLVACLAIGAAIHRTF